MQLFVGLLVTMGCVFGGYLIEGGPLGLIWQPVELMIICGAALGALILGNEKHVLMELVHQMKNLFGGTNRDSEFQRQLLLLMYELLLVAAQGIKALDEHVESPKESPIFQRYPTVLSETKLLAFIVDNFRLMAMGKINSHELEGVLEQELAAIDEEMSLPSKSLHKIAEAMPGFGILAAVLGIVLTMHAVTGGAGTIEIAERVGAAMVGTFIGIFMCYGVLDPLCNLIHQQVKEEMSTFDCVKVVLVTHVSGKPPLLTIDAGRRLVQLNTKPSFAQLETWINALEAA